MMSMVWRCVESSTRLSQPVAIRHTWILLKGAFILPARVREASEAVGKLLGIMDAIGLDKRLSDFGIKDRDLNTIVKNGFNPRALTADGLEALLRGIL
jgi:alcohol dehydrogenase class IV